MYEKHERNLEGPSSAGGRGVSSDGRSRVLVLCQAINPTQSQRQGLEERVIYA